MLRRFMRRFCVALALALTAAACATTDTAAVKAFFAPNFRTVDDTQLQDSMWRLGRGVQDLDDTFAATDLADGDRHARILESLTMMQEAAVAANAPGQRQGHRNVAMNIDRLIGDIAAAKTAAEVNDYAPAQALPATCLACHQGSGGGAQNP